MDQNTFNNYLQNEDDKGYYTQNSLAYYYDDMANKEKLIKEMATYIAGYSNTLTTNLEEIEQQVRSRFAEWDQKIQTFPEGVTDLLETWVADGSIDTIIEDARLAEKANLSDLEKTVYARMGVEYGEIELPSDFRSVPFQLYRDRDGRMKHNFDFAKKRIGTEIFVDSVKGSDTTGTGTAAAPYQRIRKALDVIAIGTDSRYVIKCRSVRFDEGFHFDQTKTIAGKKITIMADNPENQVLLTSHQWNPALAWTQESTGVYKTARSAVYSVFDLRRKDVYGLHIPLDNVATLAECQAKTNTWYTDNVTVWVHASDGSMPNDANWVIGKSVRADINLSSGSELYLENVKVLHGHSTYGFRVTGDGTTTFIANGFDVLGGDLKIDGTTSNGLEILDTLTTLLFNSKTAYTGRDGFNYHYAGIPEADRRKCLVVEWDTLSYKNGLNDTSGNNNATTAHEGICILRVGSIGYKSTGPVLADVNGCYTICIDTPMRDSLKPASGTKAAFYFSDNGAFVPGKAILINCDAGGEGYSVNTDPSFKGLYLKGFRGIDIPSNVIINL